MLRATFYVLWSALHGGLFAYGALAEATDSALADPFAALGWSFCASRGAGLVLAFDSSVLLFPVCRKLLTKIRPGVCCRASLDESIQFHKATAYSLLLFTVVHAGAHYANFYKLEKSGYASAFALHHRTWAGTTGHLMLLFMLLIYTTSTRPMRKSCFECFYYTHHLSLVFILLLLFHGYGCLVVRRDGACSGLLSWPFVIVGYVLYLLERVVREIAARRKTRVTKIVRHPVDTFEIQLEIPGFRYRSGQYLMLNVPELSPYQWHPFTITSSPWERHVSIHIRQFGDWTTGLARMIGCAAGEAIPVEITLPTFRVDGPFGAPASDVFGHEIAVVVGAGIGVTPFASVLKTI